MAGRAVRLVKIENWTVTYPDGKVAVDHLNLKITPGEHLALIGANGAGKSSLILSLVGVLPGQGSVTVDGIPLNKNNLTAIRTKVGVVFQNPDDQLFLPTIYDDIAFGPRNLGLDEESVRYRVEDRLNLLHISHLRDRTALKLSGGEKRMAAMATVLAMKPSVMALDEPTAFLDPKARRNLIRVLKELPHTMLIATHDLAFAAEVCPRSVLLREGKLFADGPSDQLLYDEAKMDKAGVEAIGAYLGGKQHGTG
jgi:cobalt/nickel transport system ATP-binding protein